MKRKAPWILGIAFSAVSMTAIADRDPMSESAAVADAQAQQTPAPSSTAPNALTFTMADRDSNGAIDLQEASEAGVNFAAFDEDGDGSLSSAEYESAVGEMMERSR